MGFIVTPGQLQSRSELYLQLATYTEAGINLVNGLETIQRAPPSRAFRKPLKLALARLQQGATFSEAINASPGWLTPFDLALIEAGEKSGKLDGVFRLLAGFYEEKATLLRSLLGDLAYPVFVLHLGALIFPFAALFTSGNLLVYVVKVLTVLLPVYLVVGVLIFLMKGSHGEKWQAGVERLLSMVPILGKARQELALARFAAALGALLNAGVLMVEGLEMAGAASGSPALKAAVLSWRPRLNSGSTPSELISASPRFPDKFGSMFHSGEVSGKLHEVLPRLQKQYQEDSSNKFHALAKWFPRLVYLGVALMVAVKVVSFYQGYFQQVNDIMK